MEASSQAMEITLKAFPLRVVNIPWRNNNLSTLHTDPPLSEQGETIIGIYLLVLGKSAIIQTSFLQYRICTKATAKCSLGIPILLVLWHLRTITNQLNISTEFQTHSAF